MKVTIEKLSQKTLIGKSQRMSLADNKTAKLWKGFMTEKSVIKNTVGTDLYSIQEYDDILYFKNFSPQTEFTKWAAIEVDKQEDIPNGFSPIVIKTGLYAVFHHKGTVIEFTKAIQYIFGQWLPQSEFELDDRPHFELLGKRYKNNSPDSEEEIWIPVSKRV